MVLLDYHSLFMVLVVKLDYTNMPKNMITTLLQQ